MNYKNNTFVVCAIPWFVPSQNCLFSAWLDKDSFLGNERTGASPQLDERAGMWMRIAAFSSHVIQGLNLPAPPPPLLPNHFYLRRKRFFSRTTGNHC